MKNLKKLAALVLVLMMILSAAAALATEATTPRTTGSITITGASMEANYDVYKLFHLNSFDAGATAYSYTVTDAWVDFFKTGKGSEYISFHGNSNDVSKWLKDTSDATIADFAKEVLAYAKQNNIEPDYSNDAEHAAAYAQTKIVADADAHTITFQDVPLGYYLVDTSVGALCGLTNTDYDTIIKAKNGIPLIDKQVFEDSTGNPGGTNTADMGQEVEFLVTMTIHAGAENYVLHDVMPDGFTFYATDADGNEQPKYAVELHHTDTSAGNDTHVMTADKYNVITNPDDDCTFHIELTDAMYELIDINDKILISYSAMLNREAVVGGTGNVNTAWISYGEGDKHRTLEDTTTTYTYFWDLIKVKDNFTPLAGAEFEVYSKSIVDGEDVYTKIPVKKAQETSADGKTQYRHLTEKEKADGEQGEVIVITEADNGVVRMYGFDNGDYYLVETKAPDGYTQLQDYQKFTIADANLESVYNSADNKYSTGNGVLVINYTGDVLPETGGIGTTLFYVIGGVLVLGAVVMLITKKRMSNEE